MRDGLALGKKNLEEALTHGASPEVNGWKLTYHVFDYNLDFFEVGAVDDPAWKLDNPKVRYIERALARPLLGYGATTDTRPPMR